MTMYSPLVYAQATQGSGYEMPPIPSTFGVQSFTPSTFDPYGANAVERTVYFEDSVGTLTEAQMRLACYGLAGMQTAQIAAMNEACGQAIEAGFHASVNGSDAVITLSQDDQANLLFGGTTAQGAGATPVWAASTTFGPNSVIQASGDFYVTFAGGETGATAPTWPTAFEAAVTDGTVSWYRLGFWVGTATGNQMVSTGNLLAIYKAGVAFINSQRSKYQSLKTQIEAATTPDAVLAIVW